MSLNDAEKWHVTYRAQSIGIDGLLRRYTLRGTAYQDLGARSPFQYTIVPEGLTVRTEIAPYYQKFASFSEEMEREQRKGTYAEKKGGCNKFLPEIDALTAQNRVGG
jgi:hypothetical protein